MTLPAAGTSIGKQIWANPQEVWLEFAEIRHKLFLHTAGRVMTLPYGGFQGAGSQPSDSISARSFFSCLVSKVTFSNKSGRRALVLRRDCFRRQRATF